jgi:cytoskeletal protein CcmA (bactofilin family)
LFGGKTDSAPTTPSTPAKEREQPKAVSSEAPTIIGKDTHVKGELRSSTDMLIEGRVEGQIHGAKRVIVGESGDVQARVEAQIVTVRGTVRGDCEASSKVEITATGKVFGNIASRAIVVAEGATFRGASKMAQSPSGPESKPTEPPRDRVPPAGSSQAPASGAPATTSSS